MNPLGWLWCSPWFWCLGVSAWDVKSGDVPPGVFFFLVVRGMCMHAQLCLTLCDPMDCSLPGSSVHGIIPARILEWVAISFSKGSSQHRDWTHVSWGSCFGRWILNHWATRGRLWLEGAGCQMLAILTRPYSKWSWVLWPEERWAQFPLCPLLFGSWSLFLLSCIESSCWWAHPRETLPCHGHPWAGSLTPPWACWNGGFAQCEVMVTPKFKGPRTVSCLLGATSPWTLPSQLA